MQRTKSADARYVEVRLANVHLEREERTILEDVNWTIRPGEHWVLAGGNGAGKSQLLKLIAGAVWPTPTGRESRQYRWRRELWPSPFEVQDEIAYVGPERQDKYARYEWNYSVEEVVGTGLYRTDQDVFPGSLGPGETFGGWAAFTANSRSQPIIRITDIERE